MNAPPCWTRSSQGIRRFTLIRLGAREFFALNSYATAARCFEEQLERYDPEDVNVRLNLASCYVSLFDFDNADRHVHYIVDRPNPSLSSRILRSPDDTGGMASGRGNYREALRLFSQNMESGDDYSAFMCLLAAAKLGDVERLDLSSSRGWHEVRSAD